jgi:plasmid stabilization system protein ParE
VKLELAPRAVRDAERHARWWRENRPAARLLFDQELAAALAQIRAQPESGLAYAGVAGKDYRRLLLPRTRFHVYYRLTEPDRIRVVAISGAVRERVPRLR